jgi:indolepyruvate ferredoxin oxidoreductase
MERVAPLLARLKVLRGTPLDPFGYSEERRMERALIRQYEDDMSIFAQATASDAALELARLPLSIRGFGPVKAANAKSAAQRRAMLLQALEDLPLQHAAE